MQFIKFKLLYLIITLVLSVFIWNKTANDWDQLAYSATILGLVNDNPASNHSLVYLLAKKHYDSAQYQELISKNEYRSTMYHEYKSFDNELHFYKIKPLYIYVNYFIYKISGTDIINSLKITQIIVFIFFSFLIYFILIKNLSAIPSLLLFTIFTTFGCFLDIAKELTPDLMSTFSLVFLTYCYLKKYEFKYTYSLMIISSLIRPDNVLFCICILSIDGYIMNTRKLNIIFTVLFLSLIHFLIKINYRGSGLSSNNILMYPVNYTHISSFYIYCKSLIKHIDNLIPYFSALILMIYSLRNNFKNKLMVIFSSVFLTLFIRFLLIPDLSPRFFVGYIYIILISLVLENKMIKNIVISNK